MVVSNHVGFLEILSLIASPLHPSFTPKAELEGAPLIGALCKGLQSLFVARSSELRRDTVLNQIIER
jgi:1-acyl-sn-glycerol-3-phosphate acyltransferase